MVLEIVKDSMVQLKKATRKINRVLNCSNYTHSYIYMTKQILLSRQILQLMRMGLKIENIK